MNNYPILVELQETNHGQMYVFFDEESILDNNQPYVAWMCLMDPADTHEELINMADKIEVNRRWIQYPGTYKEHFDITKSKRKLAVEHGAIEVNWRHWGTWKEPKK